MNYFGTNMNVSNTLAQKQGVRNNWDLRSVIGHRTASADPSPAIKSLFILQSSAKQSRRYRPLVGRILVEALVITGAIQLCSILSLSVGATHFITYNYGLSCPWNIQPARGQGGTTQAGLPGALAYAISLAPDLTSPISSLSTSG